MSLKTSRNRVRVKGEKRRSLTGVRVVGQSKIEIRHSKIGSQIEFQEIDFIIKLAAIKLSENDWKVVVTILEFVVGWQCRVRMRENEREQVRAGKTKDGDLMMRSSRVVAGGRH
jgi:hypothetical protein